MTLKTDGGKITYWTITIVAIIATFVLSIIYPASTSMRTVILAKDSFHNDTVYVVDTRGCCGKCQSDIWYFYDDDGSLERVLTPLLSNNYKFIQVKFNRNHYNKKTKTFTFGSYSETYQKVFSKDFKGPIDNGNFILYKELDSGFEGKRWFSLLFWAILSSFFIALPLVHIRPSKECFAELMKYASYADSNYSRTNLTITIGNDMEVELEVSPKEVCFSTVYYKGDRVVRNVYVSSEGTLRNVVSREFYWVKRVTKEILPCFKERMVNSKIERIL